ncbi:polyprenyl synthetase family protein [Micromonospora sp. M12]
MTVTVAPTDASELRARFDAELAGFLERQGPDWPDGAPRGCSPRCNGSCWPAVSGSARSSVTGVGAARGGRRHPIVVAAAALELFHAFALIHDDILDGSDRRRGSRRCTGSSPTCTPARRGAVTRRRTAATPRCSAGISVPPGRIRCSTSAGSPPNRCTGVRRVRADAYRGDRGEYLDLVSGVVTARWPARSP